MQPDIEKRFRRSKISVDDFTQAIEFIKEAQKHQFKSLIHEALLVSAIIYYARPFSGNELDKNALSNARIEKELWDFEDPDEQAFHDRIILLRNKVLAHAEYGPGRYTVDVVSDEATGETSIHSRVWRASAEWLDLHLFERIATEMRARCGLAVIEDLPPTHPDGVPP
jgi:hypothetical protein